ncbi:uncharacterized protein LOC134252863 [Saccostrea cucullata]|uniref:uncharacterized protein LOC134252863 n=1 Tax=Saccostrea cuccullata TaxID=36930 RepID=UPI002ED2942C
MTSHNHRTKESLHRHLLNTLIERFLDGSKKDGHNFIAWKTHLKRYCNMAAQEEKGLKSDFSYLERRGLLSVGQYSIINKIFQKFDPRAVSFINKVKKEMADLPSEQKMEAKSATLKIEAFILPVEKTVENALWEIIHDTVSYIESSPDPVVSTEEALEILDSNSAGSRKKPKLKDLIDKTLKIQKESLGDKDHVNGTGVLKSIFLLYQKLRKMNHLKRLKIGPKGSFVLLAEFSTVVDLKSCLAESNLKILNSDVTDLFATAYEYLGVDMKYGNVIVKVKEAGIKEGRKKSPEIDRGSPEEKRAAQRRIAVDDLNEICHITFVLPDQFWVSDSEGSMILVNYDGEILDTLKTKAHACGKHAITNKGELLYLDHGCVMKYVLGHGAKTLVSDITCGGWWEWSIFCSHQNGDILVGMTDEDLDHGRVLRFNKIGELMQTLEFSSSMKHLYSVPRYITENVNRDVCTSDNAGIVVVDRAGKHRFTYHLRIPPHGLCTDSHGHIIACNWTSAIYVINRDGHLLSILGVDTRDVISLCIDEEHNLYLGSDCSNTISVYKMSKEDTAHKCSNI